MLNKTISDLVTSYVNFNGLNSKGWSRCYCEVCGDGSRTKGPRGGWLFQGEMAFYHCFNCGIDANFDPDREHPLSKDMWKVLVSFGVPENEFKAVAYAKKISSTPSKNDGKKPEHKVTPLKFFDIPKHFYPLEDAPLSNSIATQARKFLREKYSLTQDDYPFYLSTGIPDDPKDIKESLNTKALVGRLIIPFFKNGKMIYYQARALDPKNSHKYLNLDVPKTNIIFNLDQLYQNMHRPLYVFEGVFDAIHVGGVAVMENNLTSQQAEILNRSPRQKIVVPDRNSDSRKLVNAALEQGWGIALPELGSGSKDLCEGIQRFGKLHVLNSLVKKTYIGPEAKLRAAFL